MSEMNRYCCDGHCSQGRDCCLTRAAESYKKYEGAKSELTLLAHVVVMLLIIAIAVGFAVL